MMQVPDLPEGSDPSTIEEIAELLLEALPEKDRPEARGVLTEGILAWELKSLADHPSPRRLIEVVYEKQTELLGAVAPEARLDVLKAEAQRVAIEEQMNAALTLAIARYLQVHPKKKKKAGEWMDAEVEAWTAKPTAGIQEEATRRLTDLEAWENQVGTRYPAIWESYRLTYIHAKLTLQSARSGSFATASGSFYNFLLDVGAPVDELAIF
jgi:hypothetical protein